MLPNLLMALGVNLLLAGVALALELVSMSGAVGGAALGVAIYLAVGPYGYAVLLFFFAIASGATMFRYEQKEKLGVAQEAKGRRNAIHAAANCLVPLICAVGWKISVDAPWKIAYTAAFATALADTVSSELGQAFGATPILLTSFRRVPVGTEGAVSLEGTLFGLVAAVLLAAFAAALRFTENYVTVLPVATGAFVGMLAESYFARIANTKGLGNDVANLFNTAVGALVAAVFGALVFGV